MRTSHDPGPGEAACRPCCGNSRENSRKSRREHVPGVRRPSAAEFWKGCSGQNGMFDIERFMKQVREFVSPPIHPPHVPSNLGIETRTLHQAGEFSDVEVSTRPQECPRAPVVVRIRRSSPRGGSGRIRRSRFAGTGTPVRPRVWPRAYVDVVASASPPGAVFAAPSSVSMALQPTRSRSAATCHASHGS